MGTVTGLTAARMIEIENASIVDGDVVGDNLILTRFDTTTINAGNVRGPQGDPGSTNYAVVTSATRPGSPYEGLEIYETDTNKWYYYSGSAWIQKSFLFVCTAATRPAAPFEGMEIYETDTDKRWVYNGTIWTLPKNVSGGIVHKSTKGAAQGSIAGVETTVTALGGAVSLVNGRSYEIGLRVEAYSSVAGDVAVLNVKDGATVINRLMLNSPVANSASSFSTFFNKDDFTTGSHTFSITAQRVTGTGNWSIHADGASLSFAQFIVKDVGSA